MPLTEPTSQEPAIGDVLALLAGAGTGQHLAGTEPARATAASPEAASPGYGGSRRNGFTATTQAASLYRAVLRLSTASRTTFRPPSV
jgi:hypothetical protein